MLLFVKIIEEVSSLRYAETSSGLKPWRCAEQLVRRDHGLALALATLFRYAGPRVSEVAALQIPDVQVSVRRGLLIIRRGKGLKHREIPLVQEAGEPLDV